MSGGDAFDEEMRFSNRISDADAERLLSPGPAASASSGSLEAEDDALASFVQALRYELRAQPPVDGEAILITRLADTARQASLAAAGQATAPIEPVGRSRGWWPRLALFGRVAVAAALVPALLTALAFAGVELPEPAQEAFERLGIELPNQATQDDDGAPASGAAKHGGGEDSAAGDEAGAGAESGEPDQAEGAGHAPGKDKAKGKGKAKGKDKDNGHGDGGQAGHPEGAGPPGGVPPGNGGAPPGGGSDGSSGPPHGAGPPATPPGHGGVPPGQAKPK